MSVPTPVRRPLLWAYALSLAIHGLLLLAPRSDPAPGPAALSRLQASLAPRSRPAPVEAPAAVAARPAPLSPARPRLLTAKKSAGPARAAAPQWSAAEKADMNRFLDELGEQAQVRPKPTLAQRSLAMAREYGRQLAERDAEGLATLERRPDAPPPDPFSLEMYVDSLIKRLNRSAAYVRNDPRARGMHPARVQFRLNPDGSLKSFVVLNAADQAEEIAFIKSVVERAAPFSAFPPDINRAASSLAMIICINPANRGGGGFGFTRTSASRGC